LASIWSDLRSSNFSEFFSSSHVECSVVCVSDSDKILGWIFSIIKCKCWSCNLEKWPIKLQRCLWLNKFSLLRKLGPLDGNHSSLKHRISSSGYLVTRVCGPTLMFTWHLSTGVCLTYAVITIHLWQDQEKPKNLKPLWTRESHHYHYPASHRLLSLNPYHLLITTSNTRSFALLQFDTLFTPKFTCFERAATASCSEFCEAVNDIILIRAQQNMMTVFAICSSWQGSNWTPRLVCIRKSQARKTNYN